MPSGSYEETLKVERTQIDLINEKAQELSNLPRFTAYAKVLQEWEGKQVTEKHKIQTRPLPAKSLLSFSASPHYTSLCVKRETIEQETRERQRTWRRRELLSQKLLGEPPERPPPRDA